MSICSNSSSNPSRPAVAAEALPPRPGGALSYGTTREQAIAHALALRVMAERLEHGETVPDLAGVFSSAA